MKWTGKQHNHSEEVESYGTYRTKIENQVRESVALNLRKLKVSSLKAEDYSIILAGLQDMLNQAIADNKS
jgi:hypothetical protein